MPKTFYTDRDIEDLVKQGVQSLIVDDDVVLTDLAYDKARRLGLELLTQRDQPPAAPVRPYISSLSSPASTPKGGGAQENQQSNPSTPSLPSQGNRTEDVLHQRVYQAVLARLGDTVDPNLLNTIIHRVLNSIETK